VPALKLAAKFVLKQVLPQDAYLATLLIILQQFLLVKHAALLSQIA